MWCRGAQSSCGFGPQQINDAAPVACVIIGRHPRATPRPTRPTRKNASLYELGRAAQFINCELGCSAQFMILQDHELGRTDRFVNNELGPMTQFVFDELDRSAQFMILPDHELGRSAQFSDDELGLSFFLNLQRKSIFKAEGLLPKSPYYFSVEN